MQRGLLRVRVLLALTLALAGCGSPQGPIPREQAVEAKLRDVGELYRLHQLTHKTPPKSVKDFVKESMGTPGGFAAVRSGSVVVRYGATLPDTNEEPTSTGSDQVLAYVKDVPEKGGLVLMLDRSVRTMTSEEFKTAKLAGDASK